MARCPWEVISTFMPDSGSAGLSAAQARAVKQTATTKTAIASKNMRFSNITAPLLLYVVAHFKGLFSDAGPMHLAPVP